MQAQLLGFPPLPVGTPGAVGRKTKAQYGLKGPGVGETTGPSKSSNILAWGMKVGAGRLGLGVAEYPACLAGVEEDQVLCRGQRGARCQSDGGVGG